MKSGKKINKLFLFIVVAPTLAAVIYFGVVASDVYVSESSFVVRSPQQQSMMSLGDVIKGVGFSSRTQDDPYTVQNFILSRDALRQLDDELHLRTVFSAPGVDVIARFAGVDRDHSFENFYDYYQKRIVDVKIDTDSSIATLTTRGFTPDEALHMNERLLDLSEALVNRLNERSQRDMIHFADQEVAIAESRAKGAALELAQYRNLKGVIDPEKESAIPLQEIGKLQDTLLATKSQVVQLETLASNNPQLPSLRQRKRLLEEAIEGVTARVAGSSDHSLASKASEYQRLSLEKEFADKMLASAMATLEQARGDAQRQQQYLERISQPSRPDVAVEPRRFVGVFVTFVISMIVWGIMSLLAAGVREHHE